jgi:predicted ATP-dependent serine protease
MDTVQKKSEGFGFGSTDWMKTHQIPENENDTKQLRSYIPHLDRLFGKLKPNSVICLSAPAGSGKTTFLLQYIAALARGSTVSTLPNVDHSPKTVGYISSEQDISEVNDIAIRCQIPDNIINFKNALYLEDVIQYITDPAEQKDVVVIDSINELMSPYATRGSSKLFSHINHEIIGTAKKTNTMIVMLAQMNKDLSVKGGTELVHGIDAMVYIDKLKKKGHRRIRMEKNRNGMEGTTCMMLGAHGYEMEVPYTEHALPFEDVILNAVDNNYGITTEDLDLWFEDRDIDLDNAGHIRQQMLVEGNLRSAQDLWFV